jgi:hypothetical protein
MCQLKKKQTQKKIALMFLNPLRTSENENKIPKNEKRRNLLI